ncbi:MAG: DUF401 family protein [Firmicutes bacterium]|nr:DUF401 family protein [Bacillota bacterium]
MAAITLILAGAQRRVPEVYTMSVSAVILGFAMGWPATRVLPTFATSAVSLDTLELAASVGLIKVLGETMQKYGLLDSMATSLRRILRSASLAIMAVPALLGSLAVFGGAFLSAPLVDRVGDSLRFSPVRKAAVNVIFRHAVFFVFPFSTTLLLTAKLAGVSAFDIVKIVWPLTVIMAFTGYLRLIRNSKSSSEPPAAPLKDSLVEFLRSASPIILALLLATVFSVRLAIALVAGILLGLLLARGREGFDVRAMGAFVDWNLMGMVVAVMVLKAFISEMSLVRSGTAALTAAGVPLEVVASLAMLLFGFASGTIQAAVAIGLSILTSLSEPYAQRVLAASFAYVISFVAYLVSPLHLCLVLTDRHFDVEPGPVYRECWPVPVVTTAAWIAMYLVYKVWL